MNFKEEELGIKLCSSICEKETEVKSSEIDKDRFIILDKECFVQKKNHQFFGPDKLNKNHNFLNYDHVSSNLNTWVR